MYFLGRSFCEKSEGALHEQIEQFRLDEVCYIKILHHRTLDGYIVSDRIILHQHTLDGYIVSDRIILHQHTLDGYMLLTAIRDPDYPEQVGYAMLREMFGIADSRGNLRKLFELEKKVKAEAEKDESFRASVFGSSMVSPAVAFEANMAIVCKDLAEKYEDPTSWEKISRAMGKIAVINEEMCGNVTALLNDLQDLDALKTSAKQATEEVAEYVEKTANLNDYFFWKDQCTHF